MALPPRGDPRRPLHLAVRSMRLLGGLFVALSLCGVLPLMRGMSVSNFGGRLTLIVVLLYFVPGLLYIVFAIYIRQRKFWAVLGALILASAQLLLLLVGLAGLVVIAALPHSDKGLALALPLCVALFVAAAIAQLIYHLARSFEAIKYPPFGEEFHGFEPVMGPRVETPVAHSAPPAEQSPGA